MQQTKTDNTGSQRVPSLLDDAQAVIANAQPPQPLEPTDGPLHYPTHLAQTTAMLPPSPPNVRLDPQPRQQPTGGITVLAAVGIQRIGQLLGSPRLAADCGKVQDQRDDLPGIAGVGAGGANGQRHAMLVHQQRVLAAFFRRSTGLGPVCSPPPKART